MPRISALLKAAQTYYETTGVFCIINENRIQSDTIQLMILSEFILRLGDRGSTVDKVLRYKSEGSWFDPRWCIGIFH
jgi:hypothetical protein